MEKQTKACLPETTADAFGCNPAYAFLIVRNTLNHIFLWAVVGVMGSRRWWITASRMKQIKHFSLWHKLSAFRPRFGMTTRGSTRVSWISPSCLKQKGTTTCRCPAKRSSETEHCLNNPITYSWNFLCFFFFSPQKVVREQIKAQIKAVLVMTCIS